MLIRKDNILCIQYQAREILISDKIFYGEQSRFSWAKRIPFICQGQYH